VREMGKRKDFSCLKLIFYLPSRVVKGSTGKHCAGNLLHDSGARGRDSMI